MVVLRARARAHTRKINLFFLSVGATEVNGVCLGCPWASVFEKSSLLLQAPAVTLFSGSSSLPADLGLCAGWFCQPDTN